MFKEIVTTDPNFEFDVEAPGNYDCFYPDFSIKTSNYNFTANCGDLSFYNKGTTTMIINGIEFPPGTGFAVDAKRGQMNIGKFTVTFSGSGKNAAFIMRQVYVKKK